MVNREKRNQLAALIRVYLNGQVELTEFVELQLEYYKSEDPALYFVVGELLVHEVDADALTKQEWDHIQRLLLLLESNSTVYYQNSSYRPWTQPVAAVLLFTCLFIGLLTGFDLHLFLYFIPVGLATILLLFLRFPKPEVRPFDAIVTPFHSISDLNIAYESANFVKQRYHFSPKPSSKDSLTGIIVLVFISWLCMPPIALLLMCFPEPDCEIKVQAA